MYTCESAASTITRTSSKLAPKQRQSVADSNQQLGSLVCPRSWWRASGFYSAGLGQVKQGKTIPTPVGSFCGGADLETRLAVSRQRAIRITRCPSERQRFLAWPSSETEIKRFFLTLFHCSFPRHSFHWRQLQVALSSSSARQMQANWPLVDVQPQLASSKWETSKSVAFGGRFLGTCLSACRAVCAPCALCPHKHTHTRWPDDKLDTRLRRD